MPVGIGDGKGEHAGDDQKDDAGASRVRQDAGVPVGVGVGGVVGLVLSGEGPPDTHGYRSRVVGGGGDLPGVRSGPSQRKRDVIDGQAGGCGLRGDGGLVRRWRGIGVAVACLSVGVVSPCLGVAVGVDGDGGVTACNGDGGM